MESSHVSDRVFVQPKRQQIVHFYSIPQKKGWDSREKGFSTISSETVFQLRDKKKMRKVKLNRQLKCVGVLIVL